MYILFDVSFVRIISGTPIFSNSQKFLYGERIHQQDPFLGEKPPKKSNKFRITEVFEIFQIFFFTFYGCKDKYLLLESREIYTKPPANHEKVCPMYSKHPHYQQTRINARQYDFLARTLAQRFIGWYLYVGCLWPTSRDLQILLVLFPMWLRHLKEKIEAKFYSPTQDSKQSMRFRQYFPRLSQSDNKKNLSKYRFI